MPRAFSPKTHPNETVKRPVRLLRKRSGGGKPGRPQVERWNGFWEKGPGGCHNWTGALQSKSYGCFYDTPTRKVWLAHGWAWTQKNGPIPSGMQVDHICDNPRCVNVEHLRLLTQKENTLRGNGFSGINSRATHCVNGHEFSPENTAIRADGRRICIACRRAGNRARYRGFVGTVKLAPSSKSSDT